MVMSAAIEARGLWKIYRSRFGRSVEALKGIDLRVEPGEIFGLLGPNGAGKTTTVKILLGLTRATAGESAIFGIPVGDPASRRRVGYLPEGHRFPGYLTARETLSIFGRMSGVAPGDLKRRIPALLERVRLSEWSEMRVRKFSKGMTQRLGVAAALVHEPDVLLLDEPTDGVDPVGRREIRDLLAQEAARGRAILLNSHLLSEVERVCGRVAVLRKGSVAAEGRIEDLTAASLTADAGANAVSRYKLVASGVDDALLGELRGTGASVERVNGHFDLTARDVAHLNAVVDRLRARGAELQELTPLRSSLEDVFVGLMAPGGERTEGESGRAGEGETSFTPSPRHPLTRSAGSAGQPSGEKFGDSSSSGREQ
ncbi:MAG TPA: ABC transporter ATP-binding protein [Thermoanaerobaculia bacterium]|nr:ABC transporter ATP-binding protein [Thermoanaerobaculia bacterium]